MPQRSPVDRTRGVIRLGVATAMLATVWLGVLPRVGALAPVREFVRGNEAAGINPSAMYYTEVEAMGAIGERTDGHQEGR
jgi:hypothetical protein